MPPALNSNKDSRYTLYCRPDTGGVPSSLPDGGSTVCPEATQHRRSPPERLQL